MRSLSLLIFTGFILSSVDGQSCPFGWLDEPRLGSCYFIPNSHVRYTFSKAITRCNNLQGELVKFDSKDELDYVTTEVQRVSSQVANRIGWWVGLSIDGKGTEAENIDGTVFNGTDITLNFTQNSRRQCAAIQDGVLSFTKACSRWFGIVCERKKDAPLLCEVDNEWTPLKDSCLKVYTDPRSWDEAQRQCHDEYSELVKVSDTAAMEEIWDRASLNRSALWIGLRAINNKFFWQDDTFEQKKTYWAPGEPSSTGSTRNPVCAALKGVETRRLSAFVAKNCSDDFGFVCSKGQGTCPPGYVPHQNKCINIGTVSPKLSWTRAKAYCRFIGGELLIIESPSMQALVSNYVKQLIDSRIFSLWIGLSDENRSTTNPWRWSDGLKVNATTAQWMRNTAPTNTPNQRDCGYFKVQGSQWGATPSCELEKNFVCEIVMRKTPKAAPFAPAPQQCESEWVPSGRSCIRVMTSSKSWSEARMECQKVGADLVAIGDDYVQAAIEGEINQGRYYWIGLSDREQEGKFIWVNGSEVINPRWGTGHPIDSSIVNCAIITARGTTAPWRTAKCSTLNSFICQKIPAKSTRNEAVLTTTTTTTTQAPFSSKCGQYWESRTGTDYCYQFHQESLTWKDAMENCRTHNGSLVSITSKEEQSYLEGRLRGFKTSAVWIGATDRLNEAGWRWEDGEPFAFINWYPGEPNDLKGNEDCSAINLATMGWYDYSCNTRNGFVCKKKATLDDVTTTTPSTTTPIPAGKFYGCPIGWLGYEDVCFLMKGESKTWLDAQLACRKEGAHLVTIQSDMENKFIWSLFPTESCANSANQSSCVSWALMGECGKNAGWMSKNCKAACGYCKNPCADLYTSSSCRYWASRGECTRNPVWMAKHCSHACGCNSDINSGYWIGLNDRQNPRTFTWTDLSPVTFTNWMANKPDAHHGEKTNCVIVHSTTGEWSNELCANSQTGYVCQKKKSVMGTPTLEPYKIGCPIGAFGYGPSCYMLFDTPTTWTQARDECTRLKAKLVTIKDRVVNAFITSELYKGKTSYWTGLSSNGSNYSWVSGSPVSYTSWVPQHTGNERNQCVAVRSQRPVGLWEDKACNSSLPYICEIGRRGYTTPTPTTPSTTPMSTTPVPCTPSWSGFGDFCYKLFNEKRIWQDAQLTCQGYGGTLPSIHSDGAQDFLLRLLNWVSDGAWIGLSDKDQESSYVWSDGSQFDFSRWKDSKPKNLYGTEDCTQIKRNSREWESKSCYLVTPFICAIPRGITPPSAPPTQVATAAPACAEPGWFYHNRFCYYITPVYGTSLSWYQAERECTSSGGHLASISTQAENDYLLSVVSSMGHSNIKLWIGYNKLTQDTYSWTDGSPPIFTAWSENEPNDAWGGQKCVNVYPYSGRWNDDNCNTKLGYICKKVNGSSSTDFPVPTPILHSFCPPGFDGSGLTNKCFLLAGVGEVNTTDAPLNWTAARDMCRKIAAPKPVDIASINGRLDHDFATLLLRNLPKGSDLWIGLSDREVRNSYMWMDNSEVAYTIWGKDQPASHWTISGRKDCVVMKAPSSTPQSSSSSSSSLNQDPREVGRWYVEECQKKNAYLCQTWKVPGPTPPTVKPGSQQNGDCPATFKKFDKGCYSIINQKKTWQDARKACQFFRGDLASVLDVFELSQLDLQFYNHHIRDSVWIGLSFNKDSSSYVWSDGWPVTLTSWSENDPDLQTADSCIKMTDRLWNDTSCDELHPFVCFIRNDSPPTPTPTTSGKCPDATQKAYGEYCYLAKPVAKASWPEAAYQCGRVGMELASVRSQKENDFINSLVTDSLSSLHAKIKIGGFLLPMTTTSVWLGLNRDDKDGFRWSDETPSDYFNWADNEPNSSKSGENYDEECIEMYLDSGKWNDISCVGRRQGYVCKVRKVFPSATDKVTTQRPRISSAKIPSTPFGNKGNNRLPGSGHSVQYKNTSDSLSGGQIAGIVIGTAGLVVIAAVLLFLLRQKLPRVMFNKKTGQLFDATQGFDNALYSRAGQTNTSSESKVTMASSDSGVAFS